MKVGDLVKHKHGTLQGSGVILEMHRIRPWAQILWTAHGQTNVLKEVATLYLEVINENR